MNRSNSNRMVMEVIKNRAKSLGLTQTLLARKLGVSVPTMKRWLSGKTITLDQLQALCTELGLTLSELMAVSEKTQKAQFLYTLEQERYLSQHPEAFAFFDLLSRGRTPIQIQKKYALSQLRVEKILAGINKIDLIEWLPKNKVNLKVRGEPVWRENGPLSQTFRQQILSGFLKSVEKHNTKFLLHDYLPEDFITLQAKLSDLIDFVTKANRRSQLHPDTSKAYGFYLALQSFSWPLEDQLKMLAAP